MTRSSKAPALFSIVAICIMVAVGAYSLSHISAIRDVLPEFKMTPLELKDVITATAVLISIGAVAFSWWSWRKKNLDDAKKSLTDSVVGMIAARREREEFRYQSGDKFGTIETLPYRIALADHRELYLSKALQVLRTYEHKLSPSYFEYMMLAANLIETGRTAESLRFYENALRLARLNNDHLASAASRRVYGRAKIATGRYDEGREDMLTAVDEYQKLAGQRAHDRDRMLEEAAETYRRLIWVEIQADQMAAVNSDLSAMERLISGVTDPVRLRSLTSGLNELQKRTGASIDSKAEAPRPLAGPPRA
jgi:tetratricopeptide (TPR) repeat protein